MKSLNQLVAIETIAPASFGSVSYKTTCRLTKADLAQVGANVVEKIATLDNIQLAYNYESAVNRRIDRVVGKDTEDYQAEKPKGKHWVKFPLVLASDKDETTLYLRTYRAKNTTTREKIYYCDGVPATPEQVATIEQILAAKPKYGCTKQQAAGLENKDEVKVLDITLSNIIELRAFGEIWVPQEPAAYTA